jgi:hypothetical protein
MPVIHIEYDETVVTEANAQLLCEVMHDIAAQATQMEDAPVYAVASRIHFAIAPIEIFIQMSSDTIDDIDELMRLLKENMADWKTKLNYPHKINMTLVLTEWKVEVDI